MNYSRKTKAALSEDKTALYDINFIRNELYQVSDSNHMA